MNRANILTTFDLMAFYWCNELSKTPEVTKIVRWVSHLGDGFFYLLLALVLVFYEPESGRYFMATGLLAYAIELPCYLLLKNLIRRERPCKTLACQPKIEPSDRFSFPSGHSAAAFVFAVLVAQVYPLFAGLGYAIAMLIGIARIFLGVHYPTDIVAGMVLGLFSTWLALELIPYF